LWHFSLECLCIVSDDTLVAYITACVQPMAGGNPAGAGSTRAAQEEVTPVIQKCLTRAFRPPVTIKNFFKAQPLKPSPALKTGTGDSDRDTQTTLSEDKCVVKKEISYEQFLADGGDTGSKDSQMQQTSSAVCEQSTEANSCDETKGAIDMESTENGGEASDTKLNLKFKGSSEQSPASRKRGLDTDVKPDTLQPTKRSRQATLFCTVKKMESRRVEEEKREVMCPICHAVFPRSISNTDLNTHIDNCIIE